MTHIAPTLTPSFEPNRTAADVQAPLSFIRRQDTKPVFLSAALTGGEARTYFNTDLRPVGVSDMRDIAENLSVDREGFELRTHPTEVDDLYDDDAIEMAYTAEIQALLRDRFAASRVAVFDVTRRSDAGDGARNPDGHRGPATQIHVDYTAKSGPQRAKDVLGEEEFARLAASGARVVQINVWRPIRGPVQRSPLALADATTLRADDLIATDQVFPDRIGEIYHVAHDPAQRWYYAPRMTRDEVLLIKGWDSRDDGRAKFTPHTAFTIPGTPVDAPPRESIEVRTFVIIE